MNNRHSAGNKSQAEKSAYQSVINKPFNLDSTLPDENDTTSDRTATKPAASTLLSSSGGRSRRRYTRKKTSGAKKFLSEHKFEALLLTIITAVIIPVIWLLISINKDIGKLESTKDAHRIELDKINKDIGILPEIQVYFRIIKAKLNIK